MWASNRFAMGSTATKLAETGSNQILYSKKTKTVRNMILKKKGFFIPFFGCCLFVHFEEGENV